MRSITLILILILVALIVGVLPRPLIKPDWRAPFEKALAEEDCRTINRFLEILPWLGWVEEASEKELIVKDRQICGYGPLTDEERETHSWRQLNPNLGLDEAYWSSGWKSSLLGSHISEYRGRLPLKMSDIVRQAYRQGRDVLRQCGPQYGPSRGGLPNYSLLDYALRWPEVSAEDILKIDREQKARCARSLAANVAVINAAARTPEDRAAVASFVFAISILNRRSAPELSLMYGFNSLNLSDADYQLAFPGMMFEASKELNLGFSCLDDFLSERLLSDAIDCAHLAQLEMNEFTNEDQVGSLYRTQVYAVYYAQRAKRLGWRDFTAAFEEAKSSLPDVCFDAIIALEADDAGEAADPRDFRPALLPLDPGEVCGPEEPSQP